MTNMLLAAVIGIPVVAVLVDQTFYGDIPERHHREHDTYTIPRMFSGTLLLVMIFMGVLGTLVWWLCQLGLFANDPAITLAFFCSFLVTTGIVWVCANRYRVVTFDDRLVVRPVWGFTKVVMYADIDRMVLTPMIPSGNYNNLSIHAASARRLTIWGGLDVEQMLLRINRFDVLVS